MVKQLALTGSESQAIETSGDTFTKNQKIAVTIPTSTDCMNKPKMDQEIWLQFSTDDCSSLQVVIKLFQET